MKNCFRKSVSLVMVLSLLLGFASILPASAQGNGEEIYNRTMALADNPPSDYLVDKDPYGHGKNNDFMLLEQNELYVIKTNGSGSHTLKSYDNLQRVHTGYPTDGAESSRSYQMNGRYTLSFSQSVAFDPSGSGRKDHIAVVGVYGSSNPSIYLYVMDKNGRFSDRMEFAKATWMCNENDLNNDNVWDFNAMNFIDITAGDYDGDGKDSLVVWGCGSTPTLKEVKVTVTGSSISLSKISGDGYPDSDGSLMHKKYYDTDDQYVDNRMHAAVDSGDVNGDGIDDLVVLSYVNRVTRSYRSQDTEYYVPSLAVSYGKKNLSQAIVKGENAQRRIYVQKNNKALQSESEFHVAPIAAGLSVGDLDGNGVKEIVISGFFHEVKGYITSEVKDPYYDLDSSRLVVAVYGSQPDGSGVPLLMFDSDQTTNAWTKGGSTSGGLYLSDTTAGDQSWQQTCVETVAINGKGKGEYIFINGDLFMYRSGKVAKIYEPDYFAEVNGASGSHTNEETYFRSSTVGNFDGNEEGDEQVVFVLGASPKGVTGNAIYSFGMLGGNHLNDDGTYNPEAVSYYCTSMYSLEYTDNYYPSSSSGSCETDDCLSFDVCAWDNDNDGLHARYTDKDYTYSDPDIMAVIQAPPFYSEVEQTLTGHSTSYSITSTYEYDVTEGKSVSFSIAGAFELEAAVVKLGVEAGYATDWSESFTEGLTRSREYTFTSYGQDQVVVYRTPITHYVYQIETNGVWSDNNTIVLSFPGLPSYEMISVQDYNDFVEYYNGKCIQDAAQANIQREQEGKPPIDDDDIPHLNSISDQWLGHEGNPLGYMKSSDVQNGRNILQYTPNRCGIGSSSTGFSWSEENSSATEESESHGFTFGLSLMFGGGAGSTKGYVGVTTSLQYMENYSVCEINAEGTGASCEIGNMDPNLLASEGISASTASLYGFSYQMVSWPTDIISSKKTYDGSTCYVPVIGYMLSNLNGGIPYVNDLDSEFRTGDNNEMYIHLTWSNPSSPEAPIGSYVLYQMQKNGVSTQIATLPANVTEYDFRDIDGRNEYQFFIRCKKNADDMVESLNSNPTYQYLDANAIYAINLTDSDELSDTYTLTHTDGTITQIAVRHGVGISDISLSSSNNLTDTYTVSFTDGTSADFTVNNGSDGNGIASIDKSTDLSDQDNTVYVITMDDGTSYNIVIPNGAEGRDGKSAYDLAVENGFVGDVNAWLASLGNNGITVVGIEKTGSEGLVDTYEIKYSDGSSFPFTVTNGETPVGISSFEKTGSHDGVDVYTLTFTDGTSKEITVTNGTSGVGIVSIDKTSSSGNVDTYTISFSNNTTYDYNVINGRGISTFEKTGSENGIDTYKITYTDGTETLFTVAAGSNGADGANGVGIVSIEKTGTNGNVDTYTIKLSDDSTYDFTVSNGIRIASIEKTGVNGTLETYTVTYTDGSQTTYTVDRDNSCPDGHDYEDFIVPASCCNYGFKLRMCRNCGDKSFSLTDPTGHNYTPTVVPPTHTTFGYTRYDCSECGDIYWDTLVPATEHNFTEKTVEPTCTESGYTEKSCAECGLVMRVSSTPAKGHNYTSVVTPPTCSHYGYTTYKCANCGEEHISDITPTVEHSFETKVVESTCTEDGFTIKYCTACGYSAVTDESEKEGHDFEVTKTVEPTCLTKGYSVYTCKKCGISYNADEKDRKEHNLTEKTVKADCTHAGYTIRTCSDCGYSVIENETEPTGHVFEVVQTFEPTCLTKGYSIYACKNCGLNYRGDETECTEHTPGEWICEDYAAGKYVQRCEKCYKLLDTKTVAPGQTVNARLSSDVLLVAEAVTLDYRTKVTIKATAVNLDPKYHIVLNINGEEYEGNNIEVSHYCGELKEEITYFAKIVDENGNIQLNEEDAQIKKDGGTISCNTRFIKKLTAFFRGLFGRLPAVTVEP